ncbi:MAG: hypothetical protein IPH48_11905 [bacterium]|nr:hypothetical protein [bacterium]
MHAIEHDRLDFGTGYGRLHVIDSGGCGIPDSHAHGNFFTRLGVDVAVGGREFIRDELQGGPLTLVPDLYIAWAVRATVVCTIIDLGPDPIDALSNCRSVPNVRIVAVFVDGLEVDQGSVKSCGVVVVVKVDLGIAVLVLVLPKDEAFVGIGVVKRFGDCNRRRMYRRRCVVNKQVSVKFDPFTPAILIVLRGRYADVF